MDHVQTVMVRVPAAKAADASQPGGLLSDLEAHRAYLRQQPGFRGMRLNRSANPEADLTLLVETRWANNNSLSDYETGGENVAAIVNRHADQTVADSLQVTRMTSVDTTGDNEEPVYGRLLYALAVPAGVLAFALLGIYLLSRIYLDISNEAATVMAAFIALGILLVSAYFAVNPRVPKWQLGLLALVAVGALSAGGIYAAATDEEHEPEVHNGEPTPPPNGQPTAAPPGPGDLAIVMEDNVFIFNGEEEPTVPAAAGTDVTINLSNEGAALHNMHIADADGNFAASICTDSSESPCSDPARMNGGETGTISFNLPAGTYDFRCDFHATQMTGTLEVS